MYFPDAAAIGAIVMNAWTKASMNMTATNPTIISFETMARRLVSSANRRQNRICKVANDYKFEVIYLATGTRDRPGGQHAGTPPSAVRVTHIDSGIMAQCGEHRSQFHNRQTAIEMVEWGLVACGWPVPSVTQGE